MSSLVCLQGNIHAHTNFLLTAAKGDIIAVRHAVTHFSKRDYSHSQAEEVLIITEDALNYMYMYKKTISALSLGAVPS